jgi:hypothetical protein
MLWIKIEDNPPKPDEVVLFVNENCEMWVDSLNDESKKLCPLYWSKLPPLPMGIRKMIKK